MKIKLKKNQYGSIEIEYHPAGQKEPTKLKLDKPQAEMLIVTLQTAVRAENFSIELEIDRL